MRILVTGATGFLGGALVRALLARGQDVVACGRDEAKLARLAERGAAVLAFDLTDGAPAEVPGGVQAVVHCAGLSSPWAPRAAFDAANVGGTRAAIALARASGAGRFVHVSTPSVTMAMLDQPDLDERAPLPPPINGYAASKREAETLLAAASDLDRIILRPRGIYGPGDTALLPRLVRAAKNGPLPLMRGGRALTDLTFVDDLTAAITAVLDGAPSGHGLFHLSGGEALKVTDVAERAARLAGIEVRWRRTPVRAASLAAGVAEAKARLTGGEPLVTRYGVGLFAYTHTLDTRAFRRAFGWQPRVRFGEGLRRMAA